jgi:phosphoglycerol transferase MdoB-like AlkP superfamily enzyme
MLKSFIVFGRYFLFWLIFFSLERLIFLIYYSERISYLGNNELILTFWRALRLDVSMAGYISVIPTLFYIFLLFFPAIRFPRIIAKSYVFFFVILFSIIAISNLNLYREWGSKINFRALDMAFSSPKEAIASTSSSPVMLMFGILFTYTVLALYLSSKVILYKIADRSKPFGTRIIMSFLTLSSVFIAIRGGWQLTPINQSMSYFSAEPILNHASVNTHWNLIQDILNNKYGNDNPYKYFSEKQSKEIVSSLFKKTSEPTPKVLDSDRPNIVLIILESFTARFIEDLGGEKDVSPNFKSLASKGILFENIYASSGRTDKGLIAILSAFPSQAIRSIMKQNDKQERLPAISQELVEKAYSSSFYYGGESEFFNMKSYILSHRYQKLIDKHSFDAKDMNSKWGTYDEKVFLKNLADMDQEKQPFFSTILTLTNHEPFELPSEPHFKGDEVDSKFRSTSFYTDSCLGAYINAAKQKSWYKNTLFVIIADHGHRIPGNLTEYDPDRYRIPLLFFGEVIKPEFKGSRVNKTGSQTDLAATLLKQLNLDYKRYLWSKDLLNPDTPEFAFFNWDNGFGFANKEQIISFDNIGRNMISKKNLSGSASDSILTKNGKAYMQEVFRQYLEY